MKIYSNSLNFQGIAEVSNLGLIAAESLSDASKIVNEVMADSFRSDAPSILIQGP